MRVPDAHDEASATLAEPIGHNADHARPTCCLEHPAGNLNKFNIELTSSVSDPDPLHLAGSGSTSISFLGSGST